MPHPLTPGTIRSSPTSPFPSPKCGDPLSFSFFFFNDTATTEIYTLSLHDALPIFSSGRELRRFHHAGSTRGDHHVVSTSFPHGAHRQRLSVIGHHRGPRPCSRRPRSF